jgi:hypothetical protein
MITHCFTGFVITECHFADVNVNAFGLAFVFNESAKFLEINRQHRVKNVMYAAVRPVSSVCRETVHRYQSHSEKTECVVSQIDDLLSSSFYLSFRIGLYPISYFVEVCRLYCRHDSGIRLLPNALDRVRAAKISAHITQGSVQDDDGYGYNLKRMFHVA